MDVSQFWRKVINVHDSIGVQHHHCFHRIAQLPHIAGPLVGEEPPGNRWRDALDRLAVLLIELLAKMIDQRHDILAPVAQRRQFDRDDLDSIVQIAPEITSLDSLLQVLIRCRDQADIDFLRFIVADPRDFSLFQYSQQFDLCGYRHVADFVQKQRPAVGIFKGSDAIRHRIGVSPLYVAKKLAFHQVLGNGPGIQRHNAFVFSGAVLVDRLSDQLLARTALAGDQNRGVRGCQPFYPIDDRLHLVADVDDALETKSLVQTLGQFQILLAQFDRIDGAFEHGPEAFRCDGLLKEVERPLLHRLDSLGHRALSGDHDHFALG